MLIELNKNNFKKETTGGVKLVEFFTTWCGYCKKQRPELEKMDKVWIGQVDAEKNSDLAEEHGINAFPAFIVMKNGKEVERYYGFHKKEDLMQKLMKHI